MLRQWVLGAMVPLWASVVVGHEEGDAVWVEVVLTAWKTMDFDDEVFRTLEEVIGVGGIL